MKKKIKVTLYLVFIVIILTTTNIFAETKYDVINYVYYDGTQEFFDALNSEDLRSYYDENLEDYELKDDKKNHILNNIYRNIKNWKAKNSGNADIGIGNNIKFLFSDIEEKLISLMDKSEEARESINNNQFDSTAPNSEPGEEAYNVIYTFPSTSDLFSKANDFIDRNSENSIISDDDLSPAIQVGQLLMGIAIIVLLIVTAVMGIKYMVADPQEQGKLKQQLVGLVVSAAVIFGAFTIWQITVNIMKGVTGG